MRTASSSLRLRGAILGGALALLAGCAGKQATRAAASLPAAPARPQRLLVDGWKASFSPDGSRLAYGRMPEDRGISVMDLRSGKTVAITPTGKDPGWSPAGGLIAFVETEKLGSSSVETVWTMSESGDARRLVAKDAGYPSWSRDGKTLFVHDRKRADLVAHRVGDAAAQPTVVARSPSWYPALSPDQARLAYLDAEAVVVRDRASGDDVVRWPAPGIRGGLVAFSPDGKLLAFGGFPGFPVGLWVLDVASKRAVQLQAGPFTLPAWSADGSRLVFDRREGSSRELWHLGRATIDRCLAERAISADELGPGAGACD